MAIKCFFVEPTDRCRRYLRRYHSSSDVSERCLGAMSYHDAMNHLDTVERIYTQGDQALPTLADPQIPHDDPRWPAKCEGCDYLFTESDARQVFDQQIYVNKADGSEHTVHERTPGMMWDAEWMHESEKGPDGRCLVVICPNGVEWMIDGACSNCTDKADRGPYGVAHRCWTRTGTPPLIQVGKQFGKTCAAGGGSIQAGDYHGFLGTQGAQPGYFT